MGKDAAQLKEFYSELFGWKVGELTPEWATTGSSTARPAGLPAVSVSPTTENRADVYTQVSDLQATLDQVVALGGSVVMPPTEIPGSHRSPCLRILPATSSD